MKSYTLEGDILTISETKQEEKTLDIKIAYRNALRHKESLESSLAGVQASIDNVLIEMSEMVILRPTIDNEVNA